MSASVWVKYRVLEDEEDVRRGRLEQTVEDLRLITRKSCKIDAYLNWFID